ncbi:MAG: hypothetical protein HY819_05820 [Acidobacteria bacterium]|nr:hypothetical protein [Acidobacteriota bacterium]
MEVSDLVLAGAFYNLAFAIFHLFFWKIFKWKTQLAKLSEINSAIMQVLNLCLTFIFFFFAFLSIFYQKALVSTDLGQVLLITIALFWFFRAIYQIAFFGLKNAISIAFFVMFILGTVLYSVPVFYSFNLIVSR